MSPRVFASLVVCLLAACSGCVKSDVSAAEAEERGSALYRKARDAEHSGDIKEAIRLYNRVRGLFTTTDPIPGGNTTTYTHPQDPINQQDLDGKWKKPKSGSASENC